MAKKKKKKKATSPGQANAPASVSGLRIVKAPHKPGKKPSPGASQARKIKWLELNARYQKFLEMDNKINAALRRARPANRRRSKK